MFARKVSISSAVCAALALAGLVRADVTTTADTTDATAAVMNASQFPPVILADMPATAPTATAPAAAPLTTLNGALSKALPGYADSGISITGYVEGSWTYSAHPPAGNILYDRVFDTKTESIQFDGLDLAATRGNFDATKPFDFNVTLEVLYGWDSNYIHSNGLTLVSDGHSPSAVGLASGTTATIHPKAQFDLTQGNVELSFGKIGNGLTVTGGKFLTLVGYELINTVNNATTTVATSSGPGTGGGLYSHSYIFDEEPYTHTGLIATYNITDPAGTAPTTVTGGISRGWDQATEDDNGDIDFMGQYRIAVPNKYILQFSGITGNEQPSASGRDGWRTLLDFVGQVEFSDQVFFGVNGMFAWQAQDKNPLAGPGGYGGTGIWYGAAAYAKYVQSDYVTFNARAEWFDDQNGGAPTQLADPASGNVGTPNQFYEVTLGLAITPFPQLNVLKGFTIRPEGRWDYSDHAAFNGGAQHDQWTAALEAYFSF
jgi:hypothetical protein